MVLILNKDFEQRIWFVKYWANYIKKTPNRVWSKQHANFINSVLRSVNQDKEVYLKIKGR